MKRRVSLSGFLGAAFAALLGLVVLGAPEVSFADDCKPTCRQSKRTCVDAGKNAYRSCREDCYGALDRRSCKRSCRGAWR